jgi:FHA domain-containing protein/uncharacterized protein DUF1707
VRPSEQTREHFATFLKVNYTSGVLSLDTFSERMERLYGARQLEELQALIADLPRRHSASQWLRERVGTLRTRLRVLRGPDPAALALRVPITGAALDKGHLVLGRSSRCDVVLPASSVSRRHAVVRRRGAALVVSDLQSTNGTWVDGRRVRRAELAPGQVVWLGDQPVALELALGPLGSRGGPF